MYLLLLKCYYKNKNIPLRTRNHYLISKNEINWTKISTQYQKLSEPFIRKFKNRVNWEYISICQKLSENFIREFKGRVDWFWILRYQTLSEDFIRELKDDIPWSWGFGFEDTLLSLSHRNYIIKK